MNKFCENCGAELKPESKFCPNCGAKQSVNDNTADQSNLAHGADKFGDYSNRTTTESRSQQHQDASWRGPYNGSGDPKRKAWSRTWVNSLSINQCMGRADFWWGVGYLNAGTYMVGKAMTHTQNQILYLVGMIVVLFAEIYIIIGAVQRYHDTGHNGWWILVPIMNVVLLFERTNWDSTRWPRYDYSNED